jgi:hypothetical protein
LVKLLLSRKLERADVKIDDIWPTVLSNVDVADASKIASAKQTLELLLLLEATNCGVERDAGLKRTLKNVMNGNGESDTYDSRLRVLSEGPALSSAKSTTGIHS